MTKNICSKCKEDASLSDTSNQEIKEAIYLLNVNCMHRVASYLKSSLSI